MVEKITIHKFGFEKLNVWNDAIVLVKSIYEITDSFPKSELYCLTSQIRRAAISVPSNIAEGTTRMSFKDQARFSEIAFGSLIELLNQLIIAHKLNYISEETLHLIRIETEKISRQLNALKNSQTKRLNLK